MQVRPRVPVTGVSFICHELSGGILRVIELGTCWRQLEREETERGGNTMAYRCLQLFVSYSGTSCESEGL